MNGLTASLLLTKIDSQEFSFCLPALQVCLFFQQWIKPSSIPSFASFKPQHLNNFVMFSLDSWDQASSTHSIILFLEGGFIFPPSVNWWTTSLSHWSYNLIILALIGLFQHTSNAWIYFMHPPGMITLSTFTSSNLSSCHQSYGIRNCPKLKVACWMKRHLKLVLPRW